MLNYRNDGTRQPSRLEFLHLGNGIGFFTNETKIKASSSVEGEGKGFHLDAEVLSSVEKGNTR